MPDTPATSSTGTAWGWREYPFRGGSLDGQARHFRLPMEDGTPYVKVLTGERWTFDKVNECFVYRGTEARV